MSARLAAALALGLAFAAPLAIVFNLPAAAEDYELGALTIGQPWARASAGAVKNGAAFLTVENHGTETDRLLSAATPAAAAAELHTHMMDGDGVMRMRQVEAIELAPGSEVKLAPGGIHIMLMGLAAPLQEATTFPLTLRFEHAGEVTVEVTVGAVAAMGHGAGGGTHMDGGHMPATGAD
jgi:hypothetical protein